eukprot:4807406-Lingulodinium_polyedra.AAC.1
MKTLQACTTLRANSPGRGVASHLMHAHAVRGERPGFAEEGAAVLATQQRAAIAAGSRASCAG